MIKYVVFDLDNTLYNYDYCHKKAMTKLQNFACKEFCLSISEFETAFNNAKKRVKTSLENTGASHNRMLYMQLFLEEIGKKPADKALDMYEIYWNTMLKHMELFPYVMPLVKKLAEHNVKMAVLTDLTVHIQHRKIKKLRLENYIDVIVTSEEAGEEKPSEKIFNCLFEKCKCNPSEMLMIGDSIEKDINGAKNVGMNVLLFEMSLSNSMDKIVMDKIKF